MRVTLNGYVAYDEDVPIYEFFGYKAFGPGDIRQAIQNNPQGEELTFEINSPGGSVFAGFEMYSILRGANCRSVAEVQSISASAATTMMIGCTEVLLSPVAQVMIHRPLTSTDGDQSAHQESIKILDSLTESILNGYELKCQGKRTRAELKQMMEDSSWLPAQEAVSVGLADGILYEGDSIMPTDIVNAVGAGIKSIAQCGGVPNIAQMRADYAAHTHIESNPGGVSGEDDLGWKAGAFLSIEKNKFLEVKNEQKNH